MAGDSRDRAAAHAAVRNLAEVYGIDLLPLELNRELITPLKHHESFCSISRRLSEPADWCDHEALSTPIKEIGGPSFPLMCQLFQDDSTLGSSPATVASASNSRPPSAADIAGPPLLHVLQQMVAEGSAECPGDCAVGRQQATTAGFMGRANETPSPCPSTTSGPAAGSVAAPYCSPDDTTVDSIATDDLLLSEAEYIEYQMPLEQRIMLLEEERDTLVDKLLSTTEALHALEARNRESQATASQVSALLDQLQELLRRAEAERDRAKMQLRRQRLSVSQIRCEATGVTAASAANAFCSMADIQEHPAGTAAVGCTGPGEDSHDRSTVLGTADDGDALLFQRKFKRHKSSNGGSDHAGSDLSLATDCAGRSCGRAPDAVDSSSSSNMGAEAELGAAEDFQPSSNEARPPVKTAIHGFEKLMKQHNHATAVRGRNSSSGSGSGSSSSGGDCGSSPPKLLRASFEATAAAAAAAGGGGATSAGATSAGDAGCDLVSNAALLSHLITSGTTSGSGSSTPTAGTPTSYAAVAASSGVNVSRMWEGSSSSSNSPRIAPPPLSHEPSPKKPAGKGGAVRGFPAHKHSRAASRASPLGPRQPQATNMAADGHCLWDGNTRRRRLSQVARAASGVVGGAADEGGNHSSSERTSSAATAVFSTAAVVAVVQAEGRAGQLQQETKQGVDVYDPEKFKDAAAAAAVTSRLAPLAGSPAGHLLEHMPSDHLAPADSAADGDGEVCAEVLAPGVEQQQEGNKQHGAPCRPEDSCKKKKHRSGVSKGLAIAATAAATAHPAVPAGEAVHASTITSSAGTAPTVPAPAPAPQHGRGWRQSWFALAVLALLLLAGASMSMLHGNSRKLDHQLEAVPAEAGKDVARVQALQAQLAAMQQKVVQLEQQLMDQPVCVAPAMAGSSGDTLSDDEL